MKLLDKHENPAEVAKELMTIMVGPDHEISIKQMEKMLTVVTVLTATIFRSLLGNGAPKASVVDIYRLFCTRVDPTGPVGQISREEQDYINAAQAGGNPAKPY